MSDCSVIDLGYIPQDYPRLAVTQDVSDSSPLFTGNLPDDVNVLVHPRRPAGDFNALAVALLPCRGQDRRDMNRVSASHIDACKSSLDAQGRKAADFILNDLTERQRHFNHVALRVIPLAGYTDRPSVHLPHIDGGDHHLTCSYNAPTTHGLRNEDARLVMNMPRAEQQKTIKKLQEENPALDQKGIYLSCAKNDDAIPIVFKPGDLVHHLGAFHRLDLDCFLKTKTQPRPGYIHYAEKPGSYDTPRLLLVCREPLR